MNAKTNNRDIYDNSWAVWEDMKIIGPASRWLRWLAKEALNRSGLTDVRTVLDFGCGTGVNTSFISKIFPMATVTGCDISQAGIDIAIQRYQSERIGFLVDDGTITLQKQYDLICCFEVLEHIEQWKPLLKLMAAHTRYLILSTPTGRMRPFEAAVGHVRNFKRGELEAELLLYGAHARVLFYAGFPFYSPLYRDVCQLVNIGTASYTRTRYGVSQRIVSHFLYVLFRFFSLRSQGDQFCGIFKIEKK